MACNHAVWPLEFRRKEVATKERKRITSDFHTGYKWDPGHLLFPAVVSGLWLGTHISPAGNHGRASFSLLGSTEPLPSSPCKCWGRRKTATTAQLPFLSHPLSDLTLSQSLLNFSVCRVSGVHGTATLLFGRAAPLSPVWPSLPAPRTLDSRPCPLYMWLFPVALG